MIIFLPTLFLLVTIAAILIANRLRPDPRLFWSISSAGAFLALISNIYLRLKIPVTISQSLWQINGLDSINIQWSLDAISWSLSFAFLTFLLIFLLIEVGNFLENSVSKWIEILAIMTLVNLSAISGNLLTLAFFWIAIDIYLPFKELRSRKKANLPAFLPVMLAKNMISIFLLLGVFIARQSPLFIDQKETLNGFLLLILGLRLGLFYLDVNKYPRTSGFLSEQNFSRMVSLLPNFVLMGQFVRIAALPAQFILWLSIISMLMIAYRWNLEKKLEEAFPNFLILSMGLIFILASQGLSAAALSVLILTLIIANLIPLFPKIASARIGILVIILWAYSALPYSPLSAVALLYQEAHFTLVIIFTLLQALMLSGWISIIKKMKLRAFSFEKWQGNIYSLVLLTSLSVFVYLSFALLPFPPSDNSGFSFWPLIALSLSFAFSSFRHSQEKSYISKLTKAWRRSEFAGLGQSLMSQIANLLTNLLHLFSNLLEGSAGVLWALLLIILMLSLVGQIGAPS